MEDPLFLFNAFWGSISSSLCLESGILSIPLLIIPRFYWVSTQSIGLERYPKALVWNFNCLPACHSERHLVLGEWLFCWEHETPSCFWILGPSDFSKGPGPELKDCKQHSPFRTLSAQLKFLQRVTSYFNFAAKGIWHQVGILKLNVDATWLKGYKVHCNATTPAPCVMPAWTPLRRKGTIYAHFSPNRMGGKCYVFIEKYKSNRLFSHQFKR